MKKKRLLIIGAARHGKDSVCQILKDGWGYDFVSSSMAALEKVIYPVLQPKYGYTSLEEAYEDRVNHRAEWKELITAYNTPQKARLAREIMQDNDIYCGMRCVNELDACVTLRLFDHIVWVDASYRKEPEPVSSNTLTRDVADYVIDNNGNPHDLIVEVFKFMRWVNES